MKPLVVFAFLGASIAGLFAQQQKPPVFRSGVDLVTVEVLVLDKNGRPVTDLTAADFTVSAGGRGRRIVAADYVPAVTAPAAAPSSIDRLVPASTSNAGHGGRTSARSFLFLVDTESIRAGEGRDAMKSIATFLDGLRAEDLAGLVSMPTGTPRVDLTTNRDSVKQALGLITGVMRRGSECDPTLGEAAGIVAGDDNATQALLERTVSMIQCRGEPPPDRRASLAMDRYRLHARAILDTAASMATTMAPLLGLKTLVLVSGGIVSDVELRDYVASFSASLERARVLLYALHLNVPVIEASAKTSTIRTGLLDDRVGFDGLADAAYAGGGEAFRAIASATPALNLMDAQLGGYYQLAFERDPIDKEQARLALDIRVGRPGATVRSRRMVTIASSQPAAAADPRAAIGGLLRAVTMDSTIALDIDTYMIPAALPSTDTRVLVAAEIGDTGRPIVAVGYEITNASGKAVADTFDSPPALVSLDGRRQSYVVTVPLPPGSYRIKFGVVNDNGQTGSIEHAFVVRPQPADAVHLSDVVLGDNRSGALRPVARVTADMTGLIVRVDLDGPTAALIGASARLRLTRTETPDPPVLDETMEIRAAGTSPRRVLAAELDLAKLVGGVYEVSVTVTTSSGDTTVRRRFTRPSSGGLKPADYSVSATIGFTFDARLAGTRTATRPNAASRPTTVAITAGSKGRTP